jgi:hypothetical protein
MTPLMKSRRDTFLGTLSFGMPSFGTASNELDSGLSVMLDYLVLVQTHVYTVRFRRRMPGFGKFRGQIPETLSFFHFCSEFVTRHPSMQAAALLFDAKKSGRGFVSLQRLSEREGR